MLNKYDKEAHIQDMHRYWLTFTAAATSQQCNTTECIKCAIIMQQRPTCDCNRSTLFNFKTVTVNWQVVLQRQWLAWWWYLTPSSSRVIYSLRLNSFHDTDRLHNQLYSSWRIFHCFHHSNVRRLHAKRQTQPLPLGSVWTPYLSSLHSNSSEMTQLV